LNPDIKDNEIFPSEFKVFRKDRRDTGDLRKGSGVFIVIRKTLPGSKMKLTESCKKSEIIWISLSTTEGSIYIGNYYRPPTSQNPIDSINGLRISLLEITRKAKGRPIYLFGDFNLPDIDWSVLTSTNNNYPANINNTRPILKIINDNGLTQLVDTPTRHQNNTHNILDLLLTNHTNLINNLSVEHGISDHEAIHCNILSNPL
jgi:hypothetical protein